MELGVGQVCGDWRNHRLDLLDSNRNLVHSRYNDRNSLGHRYCGLNMLDRDGLNSVRSSSGSTEMKIS